MHKKINSILYFLLTILILNGLESSAQNFADKDYYLVDSLDISIIAESDKLLLDSCLTVYHQVKHDTDKLNAISIIVEESWDENIWPKYNLWIHDYTSSLLKKRLKGNTKRKISLLYASAINNLGYYNSTKGNVSTALKLYLQSLAIEEEFNDVENIPTSLNNIGAIYNKFGDIPNALVYYHKSLSQYKTLKNDQGLAQTQNNIGHIYVSQEDYHTALEYFFRSLSLYKKLEIKRGISTLLNSIGFVYFKQNNLEKAIDYYYQALEIRENMNSQKDMATSYNNIALVYESQLDFVKAKEYYNKSIAIYEVLNHKEGLSASLNNLGRIYLLKNKVTDAKMMALRSFKIANETGAPDNIRASALTLSQIYEKEGSHDKALNMYKLYVTMKDSINNDKTQQSTTKLQAKYEYETNKAIDDAENDKLVAIEQGKKEKQIVISIATGFGLVLVIVFLFFVVNRLNITRKQKVVIETQNKEIVDSITYAKRIQDAILPTNKWVKECLPESFLYYQPKAIVAGDFYWVESVTKPTSLQGTKQSAQKDESTPLHHENIRDTVRNDEQVILFAAADCTGHGVPGAMVSVVCHNALNRVIREFNIVDPGKILDKTRELIVEQLNKAENASIDSIGNIRDGMDIALCTYHPSTKKLRYAGANNPLWLIRKGESEIEEIKATKQAIGKVEHPKAYQTHDIQLNTGDIIYLFSDGFVDQFGGEKGKKLKSKPFKKLLLSIKDQSMSEQQQSLHAFFEKWKGNLEQIDDVCVFGIKV